MHFLAWKGVSPLFIFLFFLAALAVLAGLVALLRMAFSRGVRPRRRLAALAPLVLLVAWILWSRVLFSYSERAGQGYGGLEIVLYYLGFWGLVPGVAGLGAASILGWLRRRCRRIPWLDSGQREPQQDFDPGRRSMLRAACTGACVLAPGGIFLNAWADSAPGSQTVRLQHARLPLPCPRPIWAGVISDLHAGFFLSRDVLEQAATLLEASAPDVILCPGDIVDYSHESLEEIAWFVRRLATLAPCFIVPGNHDIFSGWPELEDRLRRLGMRSLLDASAPLPGSDGSLDIVGAGDLRTLGGPRPALADARPGALLLTHDPDLVFTLSEGEREKTGVVIAGHTHGGQVRLPGIGPLVYQADRRLQPGLTRLPGLPPVLVTAGLGQVTLPLRLNCPPQVSMLEIVPQGEAAAVSDHGRRS